MGLFACFAAKRISKFYIRNKFVPEVNFCFKRKFRSEFSLHANIWKLILASNEYFEAKCKEHFVKEPNITKLNLVVHSTMPTVIAHCTRPTAYCPLLTVHCLLPTAFCPLSSAHCLLPTAHCPLPTAHCLLQTAHCLLLTVYCPLPTVYGPLSTVYYLLFLLSTVYCPLSTVH
jgi:hypothetical protein